MYLHCQFFLLDVSSEALALDFYFAQLKMC